MENEFTFLSRPKRRSLAIPQILIPSPLEWFNAGRLRLALFVFQKEQGEMELTTFVIRTISSGLCVGTLIREALTRGFALLTGGVHC